MLRAGESKREKRRTRELLGRCKLDLFNHTKSVQKSTQDKMNYTASFGKSLVWTGLDSI